MRVMQSPDGKRANWERLGKHYRRLLYQRGAKEPDRNRAGIDAERIREVLANDGQLTIREALHCRVRYFSDGMILGSRVFVDEAFQRYRGNFGTKRWTGAQIVCPHVAPSLFTRVSLRAGIRKSIGPSRLLSHFPLWLSQQ